MNDWADSIIIVWYFVFCKATVEPMQIDTGPEDSDSNRAMVENTTLVNVKAIVCFLFFWY